MTSGAKEDNDIPSKTNADVGESENKLVHCIKFVDKIKSVKEQVPVVREGTESSTTFIQSRRDV